MHTCIRYANPSIPFSFGSVRDERERVRDETNSFVSHRQEREGHLCFAG